MKPQKIIIWSAIAVVGLALPVLFTFILHVPKVILPETSIAAEKVLGPVTNTLLATLLADVVLVLGAWLITRRMKAVPGRVQGAFETIIEGFYGLVEGVAGYKWARRFFPIVMTIFLFLLVSNLLGLTPLYGGWGVLHHSEEGLPVKWLNSSHTFGLWEPEDNVEPVPPAGDTTASGTAGPAKEGGAYVLAPFFRSAATDLNTTVALALISVLLTQVFGVWALGPGYFGKFISVRGIVRAFTKPGLGCLGRIGAFFMGAIDFAVGLLETISEFSKIISFSFRLFGNVFAGEVLLGVMAFLIPYLVSLPFYGLEIFVGVVQALVFMMLSVAFFVLATTGHGAEGH